MTYIRIPVPRLDAGLGANLLGLLGLIALVCAPGALTGDWAWTLVTGGLAGVGLSYLVSAQLPDAGAAARPRHLKAADR